MVQHQGKSWINFTETQPRATPHSAQGQPGTRQYLVRRVMFHGIASLLGRTPPCPRLYPLWDKDTMLDGGLPLPLRSLVKSSDALPSITSREHSISCLGLDFISRGNFEGENGPFTVPAFTTLITAFSFASTEMRVPRSSLFTPFPQTIRLKCTPHICLRRYVSILHCNCHGILKAQSR